MRAYQSILWQQKILRFFRFAMLKHQNDASDQSVIYRGLSVDLA